jgi:uncharacterized protein (DUF1501 family)
MERRHFLRLTSTYTGGLLIVPSFLSATSLFEDGYVVSESDNILIFIQLNGGNDGLNTFVPYGDAAYYANRRTIGIKKEDLINKTNRLGFHPAFKDVAQMAQNGHLSIIQNVGYPNPNRSHFRSQEIWQTASDADTYPSNGWLGRYLDIQCHDEYLSAINLDSIDNLALKSDSIASLTIKDPNKLRQLSDVDVSTELSGNPQLDFVRKIAYSSTEGMNDIQAALKRSNGSKTSYANNPLAKNLQWISQLIKGKLNSKVYYTSLNGFDTHNNQLGAHNRQLTILNDALWSFYSDMKAENRLPNVTVVVFSEFGRRVAENGTGTDHGTAGPMMIIGGKNKGNIVGKLPNLTKLDASDLIYDIDFRSVYGSLLQNKFGFDPSKINIEQSALEGLF